MRSAPLTRMAMEIALPDNANAMLGALAALASAASWAVGSILFRKIGDEIEPLAMNLGKGLIGLVLLSGVLLVVGVEPLDSTSLGFLVLSGLIGIALGDTLFFMALVRLEPRLTLLLATGTGIAPFLSILQDFEAWQRFERIILVYSVREARELAYQRLIAELPQRDYLEGLGTKLLYLPVVTRERVPGALQGRITTLIENGELERAADLQLTPEHSRIMLCGNPQMIEDTRAILKARDLNLSLTRRPGQVAVENYW